MFRHPLASSSRSADSPIKERGGRQIRHPACDARARHTRRLPHSRNAAVPDGLRLRCAPQTPRAFIKMRREKDVGLLHRCHAGIHAGEM